MGLYVAESLVMRTRQTEMIALCLFAIHP